MNFLAFTFLSLSSGLSNGLRKLSDLDFYLFEMLKDALEFE